MAGAFAQPVAEHALALVERFAAGRPLLGVVDRAAGY
jgi:hypothetical protein